MKVLQRQKKNGTGGQTAGWLRQRLQKLASWLSGKKGIHYINGSQTLPPPLNRQEEEEVFSDLLSCDEPVKQSARQLLIKHNLRLVVYIAKKFESTGINIEDLISIGTIGLIKAVNTFSPEKNIKLATYASRCIENEILMYLRKNQNRRREISIDGRATSTGTATSCCFRTCGHRAGCGEQRHRAGVGAPYALSGNCRPGGTGALFMELRFGLQKGGREHTQKEVADLIGISQSYISRLEKRSYPAAAKEAQADEPRKQGRKLIKSDRLKGRYLPNAGKTPALFAVFTG